MILAKAFRFTPAEGKLACIVARGASTQLAARELKISLATVRNQLKSLIAKTDTHRQSQLVARAVQRSIVSPFSNGIEEFEGQRRTKDS